MYLPEDMRITLSDVYKRQPLRLIWIIIGKPVMTVGNFTKGYLKKLLHLCDYYAKINKKKLSAQMRFIRRKKDKTES